MAGSSVVLWTIGVFGVLVVISKGINLWLLDVCKKTVQHHFAQYYNQTEVEVTTLPEYSYDVASAIFCGALCLFGGICAIRKSNKRNTVRKNVKAVAVEMGSIIVHLLLILLINEFIQFMMDVPTPHFLGLKKQFCTVDGKLSTTPDSPDTKIDGLCQIYPSFFCVIMTYWTTFLYLYMDHLATSEYDRLVQYHLFVAMSGVCFTVFTKLHNDGELFGLDICYGAGLGIINAALAVSYLFGSVFRARSAEATRTTVEAVSGAPRR